VKRIVAAKLLGIAAGPTSLLVAELSSQKGSQKLLRTVQVDFTAEASLEKPLGLAKALREQLKNARVTTRDVVVALPARWLVTRRKELPPVSAAVAASTLRLYAEAEFGADFREFGFDYAGSVSGTAPAAVLLVGTSRSLLEQCRQVVEGAGLRLLGVTSSGAAMASLLAGVDGQSTPLLSLSPLGTELVLQHGGVPTHLRHVAAVASTDGTALATDLRRTLAGLPPMPPGSGIAVVGGGRNECAALAGRLAGLKEVPPARLLADVPDIAAPFLPAIAAGVAAFRSAEKLIDFVGSRLAPPQVAQNRRPAAWAAAMALTLVVAGAIGWFDLRQQRLQNADAKARLNAMAGDIRDAEIAAARLETARGASGGSGGRFVPFLTQMTQMFPDDGSVWVTSLTLRQNMVGQLSGKATGEQQILSLLDRMNASKRFADLKLLDMREAGRGSREVTFSISFTYSDGAPKS